MQSHHNQTLEKANPLAPSLPVIPSWIAVILLFGVFISMAALVYWGRNRGLCITDESFCLMLCRQPGDFDPNLSCWHLLAGKLPKISSHIVSNFRLWHLIVQILSATAFGLAFAHVVKRFLHVGGFRFQLLSVALASMANLLPLSSYPLALSYNSLVSFFVYLAVACSFLAVSCTQKPVLDWKSMALIVLAGVMLGLCFFVKATSALAVFALICLFILSVKTPRESLLLCSMQMLGAIFAAALFFPIFLPAPMWLGNVTAAMRPKTGEGGLLGVIFQSISGSLAPLFSVAVRALLVAGVAYAMAWIVREKSKIRSLSISAVVFLMLCIQAFLFKEFMPGGKSVSIFFVLALTLCGVLLLRLPGSDEAPVKEPEKAAIAVAFVLALLPFCCALGTGNNLFEHTTNHMTPIFLLLLLLSVLIFQRRRILLVSVLSMSVLCFIAGWQFFQGYLYTPYGLALPMSSQNQSTNLPGIEGQRLCQGGRVFLEKINSLLVAAGFQKGDTILGFYNLPGVLLASCGTAPGLPTYFPEPSSNHMTINGLRKLKPNMRLFVLQTWTLPPEVLNELKQKGYEFPGKFKLLGSITNPYGDPSMNHNYHDKKFFDCRVDVYVFDPKKE